MDYSLSGSSVHPWILQATLLEGVPFLSPGGLPNPGIESWSPALQADSLPSESLGKPKGELANTYFQEYPYLSPYSKSKDE